MKKPDDYSFAHLILIHFFWDMVCLGLSICRQCCHMYAILLLIILKLIMPIS